MPPGLGVRAQAQDQQQRRERSPATPSRPGGCRGQEQGPGLPVPRKLVLLELPLLVWLPVGASDLRSS